MPATCSRLSCANSCSLPGLMRILATVPYMLFLHQVIATNIHMDPPTICCAGTSGQSRIARCEHVLHHHTATCSGLAHIINAERAFWGQLDGNTRREMPVAPPAVTSRCPMARLCPDPVEAVGYRQPNRLARPTRAYLNGRSLVQ